MPPALVPRLCLAMVPPNRVERLRALDPARYQWIIAHGWPDAMETIRAQPVDVAMLDPLAQSKDGTAYIEKIRAQFPSLPIVLYTALSAPMASILLRLGRIGVRRVVFAAFEDAPGALRQALRKELELGAAQQVANALQEALGGLPAPVQSALETSLRAPDHRTTVATLAEQAHLSVYQCHQLFLEAGLPAPRVVMVLARLLYAHRLLLDPGHTIDGVARKLGYKHARTLQAQLQTVFGRTGAELRQASPAEAAGIVIREYLSRRGDPAEDVDLMAASG